ncbi:ABC transporter substrate-binding protein [Gracilibacillus salinarum]|uniref:Sugar ABC transporter substrate-binding protein n=1 Tax=Gracilibacillus salinarum TaxID=2932255 RepID=A0ABY4GRH9_9BACI|nr:sugar ABC transporter substrate-binding protein [Gracilibacillus salinarum]UOQ86869.1 sugar ABC transporter substrate-binding protein [Gracilibacillus salinarum]
MFKKRKSLLLLLMLVLIVIFVSGCSTEGEDVASDSGDDAGKTENNEDQIELRILWWGSQNRHDRTLEVIDRYMEENPNVTISPEFTGWDGYWEKMATQAAGGNLPDIVQMDYAYLTEYVGRNLLVDLNPFVKEGTLDLSDVEDVYIEGGKINDSLYAVNLGANVHGTVYDPALFEEAGIEPPEPGYTYEDVQSFAKKLSDNLDGAYGVQPTVGTNPLKHYLRQNGVSLYAPDGKSLGYEDDQLLVDFLQKTVDMIESGAAAPPDLFMDAGSIEQQPIVNGDTAMLLDIFSNQLVAIESAAGRPLELMLDPTLEGGESGHFLKPSQFFSVTKDSKHQEEAAKFISYFTNNLEANEVLNAERGVPIAGTVRDHLRDKLDDAGKKMFDYVEMAQDYANPIDPPDPQGATEVETLYVREVEEPIYYGQVTPEEAAANFREKANEILAKNE